MQNSTIDKRVRLIGAASGLGAPDPRCEAGPDALHALGIEQWLKTRGVPANWLDILRPHEDRGDPDNIVKRVADLCQRLARGVGDVITDGERFCVFGGDHACAIGTWSGAAQTLGEKGSLGLIWIDAHMDSHTPETSPSGALHGMPLAALLGYGEKVLREIGTAGPKLHPEHVCVVGVRSFESGEQHLLERLGVRIVYMKEVHERGLDTVLAEAKTIAATGTAGYGITIDLDAVDPEDAPGVGTPAKGGICGDALIDALSRLDLGETFVGGEITELNPANDIDHKTARLAGELMCALFA